MNEQEQPDDSSEPPGSQQWDDPSFAEDPPPTITVRWRDYNRKMHEAGWLLTVDVPFEGCQSFPLPDPLELLVNQLPAKPNADDLVQAFDLSDLADAVVKQIGEERCDDDFEHYGADPDGSCDAWERVFETATCTMLAYSVIEKWLRDERLRALFNSELEQKRSSREGCSAGGRSF